jgi:hypothetical protein
VPDDQAREMTEAFIRNPKAAHAQGEALLQERASMNGAGPPAVARKAKPKPKAKKKARARSR